MEAFENGLVPQPGNHFVVNGKPFSGTGIGRPYPIDTNTSHAGAGYLDVSDPHNWYANDWQANTVGPVNPMESSPWALQPHLARWGNRTNALRALYGGANEPWDTFDHQNLWLAMVPSDPLSGGRIKPSYHDFALMQYWDAKLDLDDDGDLNGSDSLYNPAHLQLLRQVSLRPLAFDHPYFTGSNPFGVFSAGMAANIVAAAMENRLFRDLTTGAITETAVDGNIAANCWDIDNDGDGIADSLWIDPGLPLEHAPDGRRYKRLVALLIRDLDGRINVNANGSTEWYKDFARPGTPIPDPIAGTPNIEPLAGSPGQFAPMSVFLPRGLGDGPAEINFAHLFQLDGESLPAALNFYQMLLQGTASNPLPPNAPLVEGIPGRYGVDVYFTTMGVVQSLPLVY